MMHPRAVLLVLLLSAACNAPEKAPLPSDSGAASTPASKQPDSATLALRLANPPADNEQISQYIRRIFQDRAGNMWFGTTSDGVARFDGRSLVYFTQADGLGNNWISGIAQDARGDLWFATGGGVSRYDGIRFTTYTMKDGLASDQVWCLLLDKSGGWWFGTEEGVSRYDPSPGSGAGQLRADGKRFTSFPIPAADLSKFPYYKYPKQINAIIQDRAGTIWFASNGGGVYRYDGRTLTNLSEKDGLCNNFVQTILEDSAGNLWFGTRYGGLSKYNGKIFTTFTRKDGLPSDNIWTLYQDRAGIIWIGAIGYGLCSYDGTKFTGYADRDGLGSVPIQSLLEDASGLLWIGTSGGVYRCDGTTFTNWTKEDVARLGAEQGAPVFKAVPMERN